MEKKSSAFRQRFSGGAKDSAQQDTWRGYHKTSEEWHASLLFIGDEMNFFRKLLVDNFGERTQPPYTEESRKLAASLDKLGLTRLALLERVARHETQLRTMVQAPYPFIDELLYKREQENLATHVGQLEQAHRALKRQMMAVLEKILQSDKLKHLLAP